MPRFSEKKRRFCSHLEGWIEQHRQQRYSSTMHGQFWCSGLSTGMSLLDGFNWMISVVFQGYAVCLRCSRGSQIDEKTRARDPFTSTFEQVRRTVCLHTSIIQHVVLSRSSDSNSSQIALATTTSSYLIKTRYIHFPEKYFNRPPYYGSFKKALSVHIDPLKPDASIDNVRRPIRVWNSSRRKLFCVFDQGWLQRWFRRWMGRTV